MTYRKRKLSSRAIQNHGDIRMDTENECNNYVIDRCTQRPNTDSPMEPEGVDNNHYRLARRIRLSSFNLITIPLILILLTDLASSVSELPPSLLPKDNDAPDDCETCKLVVGSFESGMAKTMNGKHEGGDTSWEERNLKSYADSEVRLVEIQEGLCEDVTKGKSQCFSMVEDAETHIEDWWFHHRKNNVRLHDYLCINKLKKCCPKDAYGPTCQPCPKCNDHGDCEGSGTRTGTGECQCHLGYSGEECEECQSNYYKLQTMNAKSANQENQFNCLECHTACLQGCTGPSSANCTECKPGYRRDLLTNLCIDINECELNSNGMSVGASKLCPDGTYCLNTEGYYKCADCHRSCSTCIGHGRDKCLTCAANHFRDEETHNCIYARDYHRFDPNKREDETFLAFFWRRFQTDIVLKIMLNILLYPLVRWIVEKVNYGSSLTRTIIIFLATINLQMELYPFVQKMIITNFGKNNASASDEPSEFSSSDEFGTYMSHEDF